MDMMIMDKMIMDVMIMDEMIMDVMIMDLMIMDVMIMDVMIMDKMIMDVMIMLKNKKSVGNDNIPNEILKLPQLASLLLHLYNMCFARGIIPDQWRKATIVPIPKISLKYPYVPLNYRGISLLSCVYKL